jgi:hypothetical protein
VVGVVAARGGARRGVVSVLATRRVFDAEGIEDAPIAPTTPSRAPTLIPVTAMRAPDAL